MGMDQHLPRRRFLLIAGAVLLVAVAAVVAPGPQKVPVDDQVRAVHRELDHLPMYGTVLLAVEEPLADTPVLQMGGGALMELGGAVLGHLLDRGVRVVTVSFFPASDMAAEGLIDLQAGLVAAAGGNRVYGDDFVVLGWHPGGEVRLREAGLSLVRAVGRRDRDGNSLLSLRAMTGTERLDDFAAVLLVARSPEIVGPYWEIAHRQGRRPLILLGGPLPAGLEPVDGVFAGGLRANLETAAAYEVLSGREGEAVTRSRWTLYGAALIIGIMLLAFGQEQVRVRRERRQARGRR